MSLLEQESRPVDKQQDLLSFSVSSLAKHFAEERSRYEFELISIPRSTNIFAEIRSRLIRKLL